MKSSISRILILALAAGALNTSPARGVPFDNQPKLLLHMKPVTTKNPCTTWGDLSDCRDAVTRAQVAGGAGPFYYAYLLVATGPFRSATLGGSDLGIAGAQFGIQYDGTPGNGVEIFGWTLCSDLEFSSGGWPASGSGNLVTWDSALRCQKGEVAIAGYFYCGAYTGDVLSLTPRPVDNLAAVATCAAVEHPLAAADLGSVRFTTSGITEGCNPCDPSCTSPPPVTGPPDIRVGGDPVVMELTRAYDGSGATTSLVFSLPEAPQGPGILKLTVAGDYGDPSETATATLESNPIGSVGAVGVDCQPKTGEFVVSARVLTAVAGDGRAVVRIQNSLSVNDFCSVNAHTVQLTYPGRSDSLDFGTSFLGACSSRPLTITNAGGDVLEVTGITSDSDKFTANPAVFSLLAEESRAITLSYCPTTAEVTQATLEIQSNDPDGNPVKIVVTGRGVPAPSISVSQQSLDAELPGDQVATYPITIKNTGLTDLEYSISRQGIGTPPPIRRQIDPASRGEAAAPAPGTSGESRSAVRPPPGLQARATPNSGDIESTGGDSHSPSPDLVLLPTEPAYTPGARLLLIQDAAPWGTAANQQLLAANGVSYDLIPSSLLAGTDLTPYRVVMVSSDQPTSFYVTIAGQTARLEEFVRSGGQLDFHAAGWGFSGGDASIVVLPGGVRINQYNSDRNDVLEPTHPLMVGVPNPFVGNSASHSYLSALPPDATRIATDDQARPTLVEYRLGAGRVVAGGLVYEFGYDRGQPTGRVLENKIPYVQSAANPEWITADPSSGTIPPGVVVDVAVTLDPRNLDGGNYYALLTINSNDPDQAQIDIPVQLHVIGVPDIRVRGAAIRVESTVSYTLDGATTSHTLPIVTPPDGSGSVTLIADGDYGATSETATATAEGVTIGSVGGVVSDCVPASGTFPVSADNLANWTADGQVQVTVQNSPQVNVFCTTNSHTIRLEYATPADSLDFGAIFAGTCRERQISVENDGSDVVVVSAITSSSSRFVANPASFALNPREAQTVTITFCPTVAVIEQGALTIASNDPDSGLITLVVIGEGLIPPDIGVSPDSLRADLLTGETATRTITITNSGGSDLVFAANSVRLIAAPGGPPAAPVVVSDVSNAPTANQTHPSPEGPTAAVYQGTHLRFGITDFGEIMPYQFPLGFEHLASGTFRSGYTVAYLSGGVDHVAFAVNDQRLGIAPVSYQELENTPTRVVVEVVTQTSDGVLRIRRLCTFRRDRQFVLVESRVENLSPASVSQIVLKESTDWDVNSVFENGWDYDRDRNMVYAWNQQYVGVAAELTPDFMDINGWDDHNRRETIVDVPIGPVLNFDGVELLHFELGTLAPLEASEVALAYGGGQTLAELQTVMDAAVSSVQWLVVSPTAGTVPAGGSLDLTVTFDAARLLGGVYEGGIQITSNDPDEPERLVTARLFVTGAPDIAASPDSLDFGSVFVGASRADTLVIENQGTDLLSVTSVTASPGDFTVPGGGFDLPPGASRVLPVIFAPPGPGVISGSLIIASNDADEGVVTVSLSGEALVPPVIQVSPDSLAASLLIGETAVRTLTLQNGGGSPLIWTAEIGSRSVLAADPAFGPSAPSTDKTVLTAPPAPPAAAQIYRTPTPAGVPGGGAGPTLAPGDLAEALANLNNGFGAITATIPNRYDFTEGVTGDFIGDGGDDMYDGGNFLSTPLGTLVYSDNAIVPSPALGVGGRYFTRKFPGLFLLVADIQGLSSFTINGNLGADGGGNVDGSILEVVLGGVSYRAFVKRVFNAFDPSVNHMIIVADTPGATHEFATDTNNDYHRVLDISGSRRLYYLLYAGQSGGYIGDAAALQIFAAFLTVLRPTPTWLTVAPEAGVTEPGQSTELLVTLDTAGLPAGDFDAVIAIASNDPVEGQVDVRTHLRVSECQPNLNVSPTALVDTLSAGFLGAGHEILLTNSCPSQPLNFTATLSPPVGWLEVDPLAGVVAGGGLVALTAQFNAAGLPLGSYSTTLRIDSDDPDNPSVEVTATLVVVAPPELTVAPDSLEFFAPVGAPPVHATLTIGNVSPGGVLNWQIVDTRGSPARPTPIPNAARLERFAPWIGLPDRVLEPGPPITLDGSGNLPKTLEPPQAGPWVQPYAQGGPDGFGYRWIDSDDPSGPRSEWVEIVDAGGISAGILGDDQNKGPFPLGFDFPFYGGLYGSIRICANGWISPTAGETNWTNLEFPNPLAPNNVIAPFWDDLQPGTRGKVYYRSDPTSGRFIVEFRRFQRYLTPSDSLTFQVILYRDGAIQFNYLNMNGTLSSATVGCEDASGQNGLTIVNNALYVHNGLTVLIQAESPWLSESPTSGRVLPGGSTVVDVTANPTGLAAGEYRAWVRVTSDDPLRARVFIPAVFHVGTPPAGQSQVETEAPPPAFALTQNVPNPFSGRTTFRLELPVTTPVRLQIFDATGRLVRTLAGGQSLAAGRYTLSWAGSDDSGQTVAAGFYFLRVQTPGDTRTIRLMYVK